MVIYKDNNTVNRFTNIALKKIKELEGEHALANEVLAYYKEFDEDGLVYKYARSYGLSETIEKLSERAIRSLRGHVKSSYEAYDLDNGNLLVKIM